MTLEDLLVEITKAIRDAEERILARIATSYPQKTPLKKNSRPQPDFALGLWIVPDELREVWIRDYPAIDLDAVLRAAAQEMDGSKKRPPRWTYDRWLRVRMRKAQAEAMRRAATRRELESRTTPDCANAPACSARSQVAISIGGALLNFCIPCAEKERAAQLNQGAKRAAPAPTTTATSTETASASAQAEAEIARIRNLLNTRARPSTSSGPQHVGAMLAAPARNAHPDGPEVPVHPPEVARWITPEREPGSDDE